MLNCSETVQLCRKYTSLSESEIKKVHQVSQQLELIADLTETDVFIDCRIKGTNNSIVVAEASPSSGKTLYNDPYVGTIVYEAFEPSVFFSYRTGKNSRFNHAVTQKSQLVKQSVVPIKNDEGTVIALLIKEEAKTETTRSVQQIRSISPEPEVMWELFFGLSKDRPNVSQIMREHFILADADRKVVYLNASAQNFIRELFDIPCPEGMHLAELLPFAVSVFESDQDLVIEEVRIKKHFLEVKKVNIFKENETTGMLLLIRDITELRTKERELAVKTVAIREVHHRVKNNLQTVASLLRLQIRNGVSDECKIHLLASLNRVLSIASVYELILSNENEDKDYVDIVTLSRKVASNLIQHGEIPIDVHFAGNSILFDSKKAVSISLVVNELVQNSIKHAFDGRESGEISITFDMLESEINLIVKDNGIGMKSNSVPSLGLDIVRMLIEHDLSGSYQIKSSERGVGNIVTFPLEQEDAFIHEQENLVGRR